MSVELDVAEALRGRRIFVVGGTGFLGKVWLSMLLHRVPEIGHVYLVVRPRQGLDPEARFLEEILPSRPFDPLRERHGAELAAWALTKVTPIPGDLAQPQVVPPEVLARLREVGIDGVVNASGLVDFNPPIDEALEANAFGVSNLIALAKALGDAPVFHTSTAYVAGTRQGVIEEIDPREYPFPRADELERSLWSPSREIEECLDLVRMARHRSEDAFRQSAFLNDAKENLRDRDEPARGPALQDELGKVKRRFIRDQLSGAGLERAKFWGWPNTYTYTKSIGEQMLLASGLRVCIGRPTVIESSVAYPFPAWNEGVNTSAPIIYLALKGHVRVPTRPGLGLDFIPVDYVAAAMIASLAALVQGTADVVYHYGSSDLNPCSLERFTELVGLAKRRRYKGGTSLLDMIQRRIEPVSVSGENWKRYGAGALAKAARGAAGAMKAAAVGPARGPLRAAAKMGESYARMAETIDQIYELFLPFIHDNFWEFRCDRTRALFARMTPRSRELLPWAPELIDWKHYMLEVHVPALEKWAEPVLDEKLAPQRKALRKHEHLWAMVEELAERHGHAPALQLLQGTELIRTSFAELRDGALRAAGRLAAAGVQPGDRVVIRAKNSPAWPIAYFGILRAGAVAAPVDPQLDDERLENVLRASQARLVLDDEAVMRIASDEGPLPPVPEVTIAPGDVASLLYTSGTTGTPKGVMLTHENFAALTGALAPIFPLGEGDSALSVLPLHHTFEFTCGLLLPLSRGARVTYLDEINGERLIAGLREGRVTAMVGVPALWQLLERRVLAAVAERGAPARAVFDVAQLATRTLAEKTGVDAGKLLFGAVHRTLGGRLKYLVSGGAALPESTHSFFKALGLHLTEGYGLTEAAPVLTVAEPSAKARAGHVGKAIPGVELKIDAPDASGVGEVLARGPNVMKGYADDLAATRAVLDADGWLRTGDLGRFDRHGRLEIVGRAKEVIVGASGENVYPDDVEALLGTPEAVKELSIFGIVDDRGREQVACLAVPADAEAMDHAGRVALAEHGLRKAIRNLAPVMRPAVVRFYDAPLPRTATRKVQRKQCREILERILASAAAASAPGSESHGTSPVRRALVRVSGRPASEIRATTTLRGELGLDSLGVVELVAALDAIESAAGRGAIDAEKVQACETVEELERAVARQGIGPGAPGAGRSALPQGGRTRRWQIETGEAEQARETLEIPEPVKELGKRLVGEVQRAFYGDVMKTKVIGRALVPQNRPCIVVANHTSHLDLGAIRHALGTYGEDVVTLGAKDYFFEDVRRHWFANFTNVVPVERTGTRDGLDRAGEILDRGKTLLLFPEGTRSTSGLISEFKPGVGYLALKHGVDVLPVHVGGAFSSMPKGAFVPRTRELVVRIGAPLPIEALRRKTEGLRRDEAARVIARIAQRAVEALRDGSALDLEGYDARGEDAPRVHPMQALFEELPLRFVRDGVARKTVWYFTLGDDENLKWTVLAEPQQCAVTRGKPAGGADCVIKTTPALIERIIREGYAPAPAEFVSGAIKTSDVELLMAFARAFELGAHKPRRSGSEATPHPEAGE